MQGQEYRNTRLVRGHEIIWLNVCRCRPSQERIISEESPILNTRPASPMAVITFAAEPKRQRRLCRESYL